jgi:hypothetical protein
VHFENLSEPDSLAGLEEGKKYVDLGNFFGLLGSSTHEGSRSHRGVGGFLDGQACRRFRRTGLCNKEISGHSKRTGTAKRPWSQKFAFPSPGGVEKNVTGTTGRPPGRGELPVLTIP